MSDSGDPRDVSRRSAEVELARQPATQAKPCARRVQLFEASDGNCFVPLSVDVHALWRNMPHAIEREARGLALLRNLSTAWRWLGAVVGLTALTAIVWHWFGRIDRPSLPQGAFAARWLPGALFTLLCAGLMLRPPYQRALSSRFSAGLFAAALMIGAVPALLPELHSGHSASWLGAASERMPGAVACLGVGLLFGGACLGWVALFLQSSRRLGELSLVAWALFVVGQSSLLSLHCSLTAPSHLALGHASVGLVLAAVVAVLRSSVR